MPKGVEHYLGDELTAAIIAVSVPLMPKGVEHKRATALRWRSKLCPFL
jgi:hypothetical protein